MEISGRIKAKGDKFMQIVAFTYKNQPTSKLNF